MHDPLHDPSNWSAVFHFVPPLTDMRTPLHAPSDWSAVFHFVASLTSMHTPLHTPSDWSAVFHFLDPLTDIRAPLHAPSGPTAVFHFVTPLIGIYAIHMFLLPYAFFSLSQDNATAFAAALFAPALVITMIQTNKTPLLQRSVAEEYHMPKRFCNDDMV